MTITDLPVFRLIGAAAAAFFATAPAAAGVWITVGTFDAGTPGDLNDGTTIEITGFQDGVLGAGDGQITSSGRLVGDYTLQVPPEGKDVGLTVDFDLNLVFGQTVLPLVATLDFPGRIASPGPDNAVPVLDTVRPIPLPTVTLDVGGGSAVEFSGLLLDAVFDFDNTALDGAFGPGAGFTYTLTDDGISGGIVAAATVLAGLDANGDDLLSGTIGGTVVATAVATPVTALLMLGGLVLLAPAARRRS